jgi:molybdopterin-biosynthesis enzyme MoeA-like protein
VAKATNTSLSIDPVAREFVEARYKELALRRYVSSDEMSESRLKMALLPEGAKPIRNPVGAAPAVIVRVSESHIISLPGVPAELKGLIEGPLQERLAEILGRGSYLERELIVESGDESELAPALKEIASLHPDVYLKSRASHFGTDVKFRVLISASAGSDVEAQQIVERAAADLMSALAHSGIKTLR